MILPVEDGSAVTTIWAYPVTIADNPAVFNIFNNKSRVGVGTTFCFLCPSKEHYYNQTYCLCKASTILQTYSFTKVLLEMLLAFGVIKVCRRFWEPKTGHLRWRKLQTQLYFYGQAYVLCTLIRHITRAFRKRFSNQGNLKTKIRNVLTKTPFLRLIS